MQVGAVQAARAPEVSRQNLFQFLGAGRTFKIPTYQREYAWGEEQIEALCEDLRFFSETDDPYYLLGQVILAKNTDQDASDYPLAIVDGQQRITSILLLLICLRDGLKDRGASIGDGTDPGRLLQSISMALQETDPFSGQLRFRVKLSEQGQDYVQKLFNKEPLPEIDFVSTQQNIRDNATSVAGFLQKNFSDLESLSVFAQRLLYSVYLIETLLESEEQALDIFEKLNSRGMPLNSADLLKNLLFQQANSSAYESLSKTWTSAVENVFKVKPHKAASMEYVMKAMLGARTGLGTGKTGVYKAWQKKFKSGEVSLSDFASDLEKTAKHLSAVTSGKVTILNKRLVGCRYFGTVQHLPLVVSGMHLSKNEEAHRTLLGLIDARLMTYLFSEEKTQIFEALVWPWANKIFNLGEEATPDEVYRASEEAFASQDTLFEQARLHFNGYRYPSKRDQKRIRFVLASISNALEVASGDADSSSTAEDYLAKQKGHSGFHLDHIHPKSQVPTEDHDAEDFYSWIHAPGNLALLHAQDNISAGASSAVSKSKDYASSKLLLTKSLAVEGDLVGLNKRLSDTISATRSEGNPDVKDWGKPSVELRTEFLWKRFEETIRYANLKP